MSWFAFTADLGEMALQTQMFAAHAQKFSQAAAHGGTEGLSASSRSSSYSSVVSNGSEVRQNGSGKEKTNSLSPIGIDVRAASAGAKAYSPGLSSSRKTTLSSDSQIR